VLDVSDGAGKATLAQHQDMNKNHQTLLAARQADVKKFEGELDTVRKLLGDALAEQADLERHLFTTQRALGEAKEKNEQLDREIRSLEQKFRSREAGQ